MLCHQGITAYENIINASSSDAEVEEADIDEDALDDATYKVYETARKRLNTSLETVGVSLVNLHGAPQHSRATSTKQKLDKVVDTFKSAIAEAYDVSKDVLDTSDSVFEESDAQWKAVELEWLHDAYEGEIENCFVSWEDSDADTDPRQVVTRVRIKIIWCEWIFGSNCSWIKEGWWNSGKTCTKKR